MSSKYIGVKSGMRVMEYQDMTLLKNNNEKRTDVELRDNWRTEFPQAVAFTLEHVAGVRSLVNRGKHRPGQVAPASPILQWIEKSDGTRVSVPLGTKVKKAIGKAAASAPAKAAATSSAAKSVAASVPSKAVAPKKSHTTAAANLELPVGTKVPMSAKKAKKMVIMAKKAKKSATAAHASA